MPPRMECSRCQSSMQTTWIPSGGLGKTWFPSLAMSMTTVHAQEPSSAQTPVSAVTISEDSLALPAVEVKPDSHTAQVLLSVGTKESAQLHSLLECCAVSQIC